MAHAEILGMRNPFSKKAYEDRKAAKLVKKLTEKKEFQERQSRAELDKLKATTRKPAEIGQEYNRIAGELGDKSYKALVITKEIEQIHFHMRKLNDEFQKSHEVWKVEIEAEQKATAAAAEAAKQPKAATSGTGATSESYAGNGAQGGANEATQ